MASNRPRVTSANLGPAVDKPKWDLHQGNPDAKDRLASAEMVSQHQQRVSELQVGNPLNARTHPGIANHGASDEATGPPLRRGPQGKFGLFAVGEVPLIEQSDLFDTRSTRQHERPMRVAGGLNPLSTVGAASMVPRYGSITGTAPSPTSALASPTRPCPPVLSAWLRACPDLGAHRGGQWRPTRSCGREASAAGRHLHRGRTRGLRRWRSALRRQQATEGRARCPGQIRCRPR